MIKKIFILAFFSNLIIANDSLLNHWLTNNDLIKAPTKINRKSDLASHKGLGQIFSFDNSLIRADYCASLSEDWKNSFITDESKIVDYCRSMNNEQFIALQRYFKIVGKCQALKKTYTNHEIEVSNFHCQNIIGIHSDPLKFLNDNELEKISKVWDSKVKNLSAVKSCTNFLNGKSFKRTNFMTEFFTEKQLNKKETFTLCHDNSYIQNINGQQNFYDCAVNAIDSLPDSISTDGKTIKYINLKEHDDITYYGDHASYDKDNNITHISGTYKAKDSWGREESRKKYYELNNNLLISRKNNFLVAAGIEMSKTVPIIKTTPECNEGCFRGLKFEMSEILTNPNYTYEETIPTGDMTKNLNFFSKTVIKQCTDPDVQKDSKEIYKCTGKYIAATDPEFNFTEGLDTLELKSDYNDEEYITDLINQELYIPSFIKYFNDVQKRCKTKSAQKFMSLEGSDTCLSNEYNSRSSSTYDEAYTKCLAVAQIDEINQLASDGLGEIQRGEDHRINQDRKNDSKFPNEPSTAPKTSGRKSSKR